MILVVCVAVWLTPRNLPVTAEEQLAIGGQVHPLIGYLGLMAAKNAVINFIILATFASLLLYRRANKTDLVPVSHQGRSARVILFSVGALVLLLLGWYAAALLRLDLKAYNLEPEKVIYVRLLALSVALPMIAAVAAVVLALRDRGKLAQTIYFSVVVIDCVGILGAYGFVVMTAANPLLRQIAVVQWLILMTALLLITAIDVVLFRGAQSLGRIRWGEVPATTQYALLALCVDIVLTMGLMGYIRSGLREDWHIYGVMRDTSQWAFTPSYSQMARMVGAITLVFLVAVGFLFWLANLGSPTHMAEKGPEPIGSEEPA